MAVPFFNQWRKQANVRVDIQPLQMRDALKKKHLSIGEDHFAIQVS
jgi:hypothetical protein